ncbi:uncharacterized protein [Dysidea avara]|uniref:uncharacterized protein isoform X2 n=1 Tax=Dysidea avara TaxID=196820 RepID=UPI0033203A39
MEFFEIISEQQSYRRVAGGDINISKGGDREDSQEDEYSKGLRVCKQAIIKPYFIFLKMIGWRKFSLHFDIKNNYMKQTLNIFFPTLFVITVFAGFGAEAVLCFGRIKTYNDPITTNGTSFVYIRCDSGYFRQVLGPFILIISAYFLGFYIMRYSQTEHLLTLTEKVFLGYTDKVGQFSQKRLIIYLRILIVIGLLWLVLSVPLNILRVYSLKLLSRDTYFYYLTSYNTRYLEDLYSQRIKPPSEVDALRYILITLSVVGFTANDLFYIAAIINYSLQCQLITFLINVTVDRICKQQCKIDQAIKEIKISQDFLKKLNGGLAIQMSLLLFLLLRTLILATYNVLVVDDDDDSKGLVIGVLNALSWLFLVILIIGQACWLTVTSEKFFDLGMDMRTRPFVYANTSQVDLDSFLLYTSSITVDGRHEV